MSCILVPNHVHSSLISLSLPSNLTAINLMAIKLNVKFLGEFPVSSYLCPRDE